MKRMLVGKPKNEAFHPTASYPHSYLKYIMDE